MNTLQCCKTFLFEEDGMRRRGENCELYKRHFVVVLLRSGFS